MKRLATRCRAALACAALLLIAAGTAHAVPIAEWDIANATGQTAAVLGTDPNLSATAIDTSPGVIQWTSTNQDGFIAARRWAPGLSLDPTRYYEFSVTAAAGYSVTYNTIDLALFRGIQGGQHGAAMWDLRASTDGFASSSIALATFDISASGGDEQTLFLGTDISALGSQAGTVTFRLYGYDYTSNNDYSGLGNDDGTWQISGTGTNVLVDGVVVATPQPETGLLLMLGLVGLARQGRPRRRPQTA